MWWCWVAIALLRQEMWWCLLGQRVPIKTSLSWCSLPFPIFTYTVFRAGDLLETCPACPAMPDLQAYPSVRCDGAWSIECTILFPFLCSMRSTYMGFKVIPGQTYRQNIECTDINIYNRSLYIYSYILLFMDFPGGTGGTEPACRCRNYIKVSPW